MSETLNVRKHLDPLGGNILVKRKEPEEITKGGIILANCAQKQQSVGEVVSIGRGSVVSGVLIEPEVKVGDEVMFGSYSGTTITIDDTEYLVLKESEILCRIYVK